MEIPPPEEVGATLEAAIIAAQGGGSLDDLASAFMSSYVVIMLAEDPGPEPKAISPLTVSTPEGYLALVVFTTAGKCSNWSRNAPQYPYAREVRADSKHGVALLVWFEVHETRHAAFVRERQIKEWKRVWKLELIEKSNPGWIDLMDTFGPPE